MGMMWIVLMSILEQLLVIIIGIYLWELSSHFFENGYYNKTIDVNLVDDQVIIHDVQLVPVKQFI